MLTFLLSPHIFGSHSALRRWRSLEEAKQGDAFLHRHKAHERGKDVFSFLLFCYHQGHIPHCCAVPASILMPFHCVRVDGDRIAFKADVPFSSRHKMERGRKSLKQGILTPGWLVAAAWEPACKDRTHQLHAAGLVLVSPGTDRHRWGPALFSTEAFSHRSPFGLPSRFLWRNHTRNLPWVCVKDNPEYSAISHFPFKKILSDTKIRLVFHIFTSYGTIYSNSLHILLTSVIVRVPR